MSLNPEANGLLCHAITQPKLFIRPLASAIQSHGLIDLGFGHFAVGMLVATQKRFRMCVRAISLASRCVFEALYVVHVVPLSPIVQGVLYTRHVLFWHNLACCQIVFQARDVSG